LACAAILLLGVDDKPCSSCHILVEKSNGLERQLYAAHQESLRYQHLANTEREERLDILDKLMRLSGIVKDEEASTGTVGVEGHKALGGHESLSSKVHRLQRESFEKRAESRKTS
jgi:hypothetical protein